jgi:hypothetical protein
VSAPRASSFSTAWTGDDPLLYDLVLSTDRWDAAAPAGVIREALRSECLQPTPESLTDVKDRSLAALGNASLLSAPATRGLELYVDCYNGRLTLSGKADSDEQRRAADEIVRTLPGVAGVTNDIVVVPPRPLHLGP